MSRRSHHDKQEEEAVPQVGRQPEETGDLHVFRAPARHPLVASLLFAPVVMLIVAASFLDQFRFGYLLIPGLWCYAVGCFLITSVRSGSFRSKRGVIVRWVSPVRFWFELGLWGVFYVLAAAFPIGMALQERDKAQEERSQSFSAPSSSSSR